MSRVRVCFLGTPDFARVSLERLLQDPHFDVVGVVSQPDRPKGRKLLLTPSPVKELALARNLQLLTPDSVNQDEVLEAIKAWKAEVAVVVAFGQILSQKFLDLFPFGAVNVHGSLLPKWRGAAPIQRSLEQGEFETGVSLQKVVKALDAGDVLGVRKVSVSPEMNAQDLFSVLAQLGADLLQVELMDFVRGNLVPQPQDSSQVTLAKKIEKSEARIDFTKSAQEIHNKVRAFSMGPGTWCEYEGKKIKILSSRFDVRDLQELTGAAADISKKPEVGFATKLPDASLGVQTGRGTLLVLKLQPESRQELRAQDFQFSQNSKSGSFQ